MIKINLLGVARPIAVRREFKGMPQIVTGVICLVAAAAALGFHYWLLTGQLTTLRKELQKQETEHRRLEGIARQNRLYEQQQNQLNQRINTIQALQRAKTGPVDFMNSLGLTVDKSSALWLSSVNTEGDRVALLGQADSVNTIADFIASLKNSGRFVDVQIRESYQDNPAPNVVRFKFALDCQYKQPPAPAAAAPAAGEAKPAG